MTGVSEAQSQINDLDHFLLASGQTATLRRTYGTDLVASDVAVQIRLDGYDPSALGGEITQQDQQFILSPTQINDEGWPGYIPGQDEDIDNRVPRRNDVIVTQRGILTVQAANGIYIGDVLVRINGKVRGN